MPELPTTYDKETFIEKYIPAYDGFLATLIEEICAELGLSEIIVKMGKAHFLAFIEVLEVFHHDEVFEYHNEELLTSLQNEWMPFLLGMAKNHLPDVKVEGETIILGLQEDGKPDIWNIEDDKTYVFGALDDLLRTHFKIH